MTREAFNGERSNRRQEKGKMARGDPDRNTNIARADPDKNTTRDDLAHQTGSWPKASPKKDKTNKRRQEEHKMTREV